MSVLASITSTALIIKSWGDRVYSLLNSIILSHAILQLQYKPSYHLFLELPT